jgi:hypothetical protein
MADELKERVERLAKEAGFDTELGEIGAPECYDGEVMDVRALLEKFAQAVARECAQIARETVCDTHIPTGVKIHGTAAAKAIRARFGVE